MYCCELCNNNVNNNFEIKKPKQKKTSHHNLTTKINTEHILTSDDNISKNIHIEKYNEKDYLEIIDYPEFQYKKKEIFPNQLFNDLFKISPFKFEKIKDNKSNIRNRMEDENKNENDETKILNEINDEISIKSFEKEKKIYEKKKEKNNIISPNKIIRKIKRQNTIDNNNLFQKKQKFIFQNYFKNIKEKKINNPFLNGFLYSSKSKVQNNNNKKYLSYQKGIKKNGSERIESKEIDDYLSFLSSN
jgi:hypothetical protein